MNAAANANKKIIIADEITSSMDRELNAPVPMSPIALISHVCNKCFRSSVNCPKNIHPRNVMNADAQPGFTN